MLGVETQPRVLAEGTLPDGRLGGTPQACDFTEDEGGLGDSMLNLVDEQEHRHE